MTYEDQMEIALKEITSHPEFQVKLIDDEEVNPQPLRSHPNAPHPTGWWRKRMYRKKLIRRFLNHSPGMKLEEMPTTRARNGGYVYYFKDKPYDPRSIYSINRYEKLYLSPNGDVRICKKRIVRSDPKGYHITSNDIPVAKKYTNRAIRSKAIRLDDYAPSSPAHYKKLYSGMINARV